MTSPEKPAGELAPGKNIMAVLVRQDSVFSSLPLFLVEEDSRQKNPMLSYKTEILLGHRTGTFKWQVSGDQTYGFPDAFDRKVFKILETLIL